MDASLKKILKAVTLEFRHALEGRYDSDGNWQPGDLETRLAAIGVWRDRTPKPVDELPHLSDEDRHARKVVDAYLKLREEAGESQSDAVADFVRETAYTWANRLLALRCMEARELIDEAILQKESYGGRSLEHHRLAQREPELCTGEDDGRFEMLNRVFARQAEHLPMLFDPQAPGIALRPSPAVLKRCMALLSGTETVRSHDPATDEVFTAPDALGWAYQYWNTEEKDRVFEKVRTQKGAKIEGADIVPATQLYTESYMVQFLVQNSLGATWMGMHPDSKLHEQWDYYVRDADRAPVALKPVRELTFLDPACGSGHFLLEAFDLLYAMYEEEGELTEPEVICDAILTKNLYGIDIDARAVQIAEAALWMKAAERAFDYEGVPTNLVAAVSSHLKGPHWDEFLAGFEKEPSVARVLWKFGESMEHIDELGSLARPNEELKKIIAEEHAVWEKQIREKQETNFLFPEMREDALSGKLPFEEITDEEFGDRLFYRARAALNSFTEQARQRGEFQDQFIGFEADAGFKLLDLLGKRYEIVAANPPYLTSKNMGPFIKQYVAANCKPGKRDLFATFALRNLQLTRQSGRVAMVTQQSWMFLKSFDDFRAVDPADDVRAFSERFTGLFRQTCVETLVHPGPNAFEEISGEIVNCVLFTLCRSEPPCEHRITAFRLVAEPDASEKNRALRSALTGSESAVTSSPKQAEILQIPKAPLCYWLSPTLFRLFSQRTIGDAASVCQGLATSGIPRFTRFFWECPMNSSRWAPFYRGGRYQKWAGLDATNVDWQWNGARIKSRPTSAVRNEPFYFREGFEYSFTARGSLGLRQIPNPGIFGGGFSSAVVPSDGASGLMAFLNSRFASFIIRSISAKIQLTESYVGRVPLPVQLPDELAAIERHCCQLKSTEVGRDITERSFDRIIAGVGSVLRFERLALLHVLEGYAERLCVEALGIDEAEVASVWRETGRPASTLPLVAGWDAPVDVTVCLEASPDLEKLQSAAIAQCSKTTLSESEIESLRANLIDGLRTHSGENDEDEIDGAVDVAEDDDDDTDDVSTTNIPVPPETILEKLGLENGINPLSVFHLLKDEVASSECPTGENIARLECDAVSTSVLDSLGFRWPADSGCQFTNGDQDGLIPIVRSAGVTASEEPILLDRVQGNIAITDIDGRGLGDWLETQFFAVHTSRFKKRPIAWQIQSAPFTSRRKPTYACLAYFHKLDGDLIRKVRKQAEDARKSIETELRGISSTPLNSRSDRQEQRRIELDDRHEELCQFDATLEELTTSGFAGESQIQMLRQYAIDDGTLSLKSCWLNRLSSLATDSVLSDWQDTATKAEIHEDLPHWIGQAVTHLQHHCATVGIKPPKAKDVGDEPTSADLAPLICAKASDMLTGSLKCACDVWWKQFDDIVLGPLKEDIKQKKAERSVLKELLNADPPPSIDEAEDLNLRDKQLRDEIKPLDARLKRLKASAERLRKTIEGWKPWKDEGQAEGGRMKDEWVKAGATFVPHPASFLGEEWLAAQPLFDEVASIDGKRPAPTTIAEFIAQESAYIPDINDGVRVNIAPLQKAGLLAAEVLARKDVDKAIADRAEWRADERRWVREGKLPQPGWWPEEVSHEA